MGITKENLKNILSGFYDKIKPDLHNHENKDILDLMSTSKEGNLLFNGEEIKGTSSGPQISISDDEISNNKIWSSDKVSKYINEVISNDDIAGNNFVSENGYRGLRYYNGKFEYYNNETKEWVDLVFTGDNQYIIQMVPQSMQFVNAENDPDNSRIKLFFTPPENTVINDQVCCIINGVRIIRKTGSAPTSHEDGELIADIKSYEFNNYVNNFYVDSNVKLNNTYYYGFYPYSDLGFYNESSTNIVDVKYRDYILYGFYVNSNESDPSKAITYLEDNKNFNPAHMDYSTNTFNYGSWKNAFFMPRPCMLKYDGTVDYYLDPNDYTKKENGEDSDVADENYEGNAMIEWGQNGKKIWYKIVPDEDNNTSASVYISDIQIDDSYKAWSFINNYGDLVDHFYTAIYEGFKDSNNKMRSLSNKIPTTRLTRIEEVNYAINNNEEINLWYTTVYADYVLISLLLILIGKSINMQDRFGCGIVSLGSIRDNGSLNKNGMFWGSTNGTYGVKVFGMENYWGSCVLAIAGLICDKGIWKYKLTYGKNDGSNTDSYNFDGTEYMNSGYICSTVRGAFISKMKFTNYAMFPIEFSGSSSTYFCDIAWTNSDVISYPLIGGCYNDGLRAGPFAGSLDCTVAINYEFFNATISCKPIKRN